MRGRNSGGRKRMLTPHALRCEGVVKARGLYGPVNLQGDAFGRQEALETPAAATTAPAGAVGARNAADATSIDGAAAFNWRHDRI